MDGGVTNERDSLLLEAVAKIAGKPYRNRRANPPALIVPVREALEAGANPNAVDGQGRDAFQLLGEMVGNNANAAALTVARKLIDHGYQLVDRRGLEHLSGNLREGVMAHLASLARKGHPVLGADGDSHLHGLAERHPDVLAMFLVKDIGVKPAQHLIPSQLLQRGRTCDGATAAHLLWRAAASPEDAGVAMEHVRWQATYMMSRYKGLYLAMADEAGRWVLDEIMTHLRMVDGQIPSPVNEEMAAFLAQTQVQMLERRTQAAPNARPGRGVRL